MSEQVLTITEYSKLELALCRLAQLSRAVGIHIVAATRRAEHEVISGVLKALFDTRIAFSVPSEMNSRLVIDHPGAEYLAGNGDMFYYRIGTMERVQGFYVDEKELENVAAHVYRQGIHPPYILPEPTIIEEEDGDDVYEDDLED